MEDDAVKIIDEEDEDEEAEDDLADIPSIIGKGKKAAKDPLMGELDSESLDDLADKELEDDDDLYAYNDYDPL